MVLDTKYTLFDNFDKLDLSAVADLISSEASKISNAPTIESNNALNHAYYNDTKFSNAFVDQALSPFSFKSDFAGYVPDMFRYLTNKRFYINISEQYDHTSNVIYLSNTSFVANNLFNYQFYGFDIFFPNTEKLISNNSLLYKNELSLADYFTDSTEEYESVKNTFSFNFVAYDSPLKSGNRIVFSLDSFNKESILFNDLFLGLGSKTIASYIYEDVDAPNGANKLTTLLQRLLYPYKTPMGQLPKHIYFVTDLDKSPKVNTSDAAIQSSYIDAFVDITSNYNYYLKEAEEYPSNLALEWQLPNAYAYYSFIKRTPDNPYYEYYSNRVLLDQKQSALDDFNIKKYYEISNNSQSYLNDNTTIGFIRLKNLLKYATVIFGEKFDQESEDILSIKDVLPYYNQIALPAVSSPLSSKLKNENLLSLFLTVVGNCFTSATAVNTSNGGTISSDPKKNKEVHTFSIFDSSLNLNKKTNLSTTTLQIFDLSKGISDDLKNLKDEKAVKFTSAEIFTYAGGTPQAKALMLQESIENYCIPKTLNFSSIAKGKKCYSEILAFEVAKYALDSDGNKSFLQSFYIPCTSDKIKNLLDTQIFYGKEYVYEIYSISLIVGAEYTSELGVSNSDNLFSNQNLVQQLVGFDGNKLNWSGVDIKGGALTAAALDLPYEDVFDCQAYKVNNEGLEEEVALAQCQIEFSEYNKIDVGNEQVKVFCRPMLVRAPYYNTDSLLVEEEKETTVLVDNPPLPPDITFNQYKDIDDKVLISLNINYGQRQLMPISVFPGDALKNFNYMLNQKNMNVQPGHILYKTDDFKGTYKVYRTVVKPPATFPYGAFSEDQVYEVNNTQQSAFEDNILPNVDYYYFARFEDIHGNISNPTSVFYLRMVREGGFPPYMILKAYNALENSEPPVYEKSFRKYLKVELPPETREYINLNDVNNSNFSYRKIGSSEQLKKYKIRITSKKTGKKIDINVDFNKSIYNNYLDPDLNTEDNTLIENDVKDATKKIEDKINVNKVFESSTDDAAKAAIAEAESQIDPTGAGSFGGIFIKPD